MDFTTLLFNLRFFILTCWLINSQSIAAHCLVLKISQKWRHRNFGLLYFGYQTWMEKLDQLTWKYVKSKLFLRLTHWNSSWRYWCSPLLFTNVVARDSPTFLRPTSALSPHYQRLPPRLTFRRTEWSLLQLIRSKRDCWQTIKK